MRVRAAEKKCGQQSLARCSSRSFAFAEDIALALEKRGNRAQRRGREIVETFVFAQRFVARVSDDGCEDQACHMRPWQQQLFRRRSRSIQHWADLILHAITGGSRMPGSFYINRPDDEILLKAKKT